jgi:hypothetical protein
MRCFRGGMVLRMAAMMKSSRSGEGEQQENPAPYAAPSRKIDRRTSLAGQGWEMRMGENEDGSRCAPEWRRPRVISLESAASNRQFGSQTGWTGGGGCRHRRFNVSAGGWEGSTARTGSRRERRSFPPPGPLSRLPLVARWPLRRERRSNCALSFAFPSPFVRSSVPLSPLRSPTVIITPTLCRNRLGEVEDRSRLRNPGGAVSFAPLSIFPARSLPPTFSHLRVLAALEAFDRSVLRRRLASLLEPFPRIAPAAVIDLRPGPPSDPSTALRPTESILPGTSSLAPLSFALRASPGFATLRRGRHPDPP